MFWLPHSLPFSDDVVYERPLWYKRVLKIGTSSVHHLTGKSLSEALIFASTNPQYNERLFIELQVQFLGRTCCVQFFFDIQNNFYTQHVLPMSCKKKSFWKRFTCTNEAYVSAISAHMQGCVIRMNLLRYASLLFMEGRSSNLRQRENAFSFINCWAENLLLNWHWWIEKSNSLTNEVYMKCRRIYQIRKLFQI